MIGLFLLNKIFIIKMLLMCIILNISGGVFKLYVVGLIF